MCLEDEVIARHIFEQPSPSLQYARYTDWLIPYVSKLKVSVMNTVKNASQMLDYNKNKLTQIDAVLEVQEKFEKMLQPWIEA